MSAALALLLVVSCGAERDAYVGEPTPDGGQSEGGSDFGPGGFGDDDDEEDGEEPVGETRDPVDCEEAKSSKSYVGCEYWPTITPNIVWELFDFAVVVANTGAKDADVTVTGPNGTNKKETVPAGELRTIYLPWVRELKGPETNECGQVPEPEPSIIVPEGAYRLVSSTPVIVYQFNALQYKGEGGEAPGGGPKDWSTCKGATTPCGGSGPIGCFSFSNDASLLLPSTAMTNHYRVMGYRGDSAGLIATSPTVLSITATEPDTNVTVSLAATATVLASTSGTPVPATPGGSTLNLKLEKAGDVAQLVTPKGRSYDFSGSLVQSTKPVQVITSRPCTNIPSGVSACDHVEETVIPAEALGKHYVVPPPTGPTGKPVSHYVRFYGNRDQTLLMYTPSKPSKCPDVIHAGQVVDCEVVTKDQAFEVSGDQEFGIATFLLGASALDTSPGDRRGDPSQSQYAAVEQFRTKYVFLAPKDYPVRYADVTAPEDAEIEIDGAPVTAPWTPIGSGPYGIYRIDLTKTGTDGSHTLTAKKPIGVQVIGYGDNTSFQYPAGLNLDLIAPPPPPPK